MSALALSVALLWVLMIATIVVMLALARQIGILFERIAPIGALSIDQGPRAGEPAPSMLLPSLDGDLVQIGGSNERSTLIFFLSPSCPVCRKLAPIVKSIARGRSIRLVLASDGDEPRQAQYRRDLALTQFSYVLSRELGLAFRVGKLPYAVLLDQTGRVVAKGLTNSREQLESLFVAQELGVTSIQQYLRQRG